MVCVMVCMCAFACACVCNTVSRSTKTFLNYTLSFLHDIIDFSLSACMNVLQEIYIYSYDIKNKVGWLVQIFVPKVMGRLS